MWVLYSERPLRAEELCHALGVEIGSVDLDPENIPVLRTLLASCLGLVTLEASSSTVRLVHFTLQEHFSSDLTLFHNPHSKIAEVCLTYLNFRCVRDLSPTVSSAPPTMPLLEYASCYWGEHTRRGMTENVKRLALELLDRFDEHISAQLLLLRSHQTRSSGPYFDSARGPTGFTGLHGVAFLGIAEMAAAVLDIKEWDINAADCMGSTALIWATRRGQEEVVGVLLEQEDIDPNKAGTEDGRTPLTLAAENGHQGLVKMLLGRQDINPNAADTGYGRTPLSWAARCKREQVVMMLLEREDVNPNTADTRGGGAPLTLAAENGHEGLVEMLLGRQDTNPNTADTREGRTPLSWAAEYGHEAVVKMLLERKDVCTTTPDSKSQTPLSLALAKGHDGVVRILMEWDNVDSDTGDLSGQASFPPSAGDGDNYVGEAIPNGQQQISEWLKYVIINHRKGLRKMYGETEAELDKSLKVPIKRGEEMARRLITMGCNFEDAKNLTLLTLYDVAILIGILQC